MPRNVSSAKFLNGLHVHFPAGKCKKQSLGTIHFFMRWGGGWWDLRGGHAKKYGFKSGASQKNVVFKGGGVTKK